MAAVPNVLPKFSKEEQDKLHKQIQSLQQQDRAQSITGERNAVRTLDPPAHIIPASASAPASDADQAKMAELVPDAAADGKLIQLQDVPVVFIKDCHDCQYTVAHRTTKIFVESCSNLTLTLDASIVTRTVEVWKCSNTNININTAVKTLQLDLMKGDCNVNWQRAELFYSGSIVWQNVESLAIKFADKPQHDMSTGFKDMVALLPDSNVDIDQFIIRFLGKEEADYKLVPERCIRLKNGFLSTEREAIEWDKRNEAIKEAHVAAFLKESGIKLNAKQDKKIPMNAECPCKSGKKYKKCCFGVKEAAGVAGSIKYKI